MAKPLTGSDGAMAVAKEICDCNRGAAEACRELLRHAEAIDPDYAPGRQGYLRLLDEMGLRGDRLRIFFYWVCGGNVAKLVALLRVKELGLPYLTMERIEFALNHLGEGIDFVLIRWVVGEYFLNFDTKALQ